MSQRDVPGCGASLLCHTVIQQWQEDQGLVSLLSLAQGSSSGWILFENSPLVAAAGKGRYGGRFHVLSGSSGALRYASLATSNGKQWWHWDWLTAEFPE